jgi:phosphatidylglycerol:prolipoprotein diacylglycerol transferase
MGTAQVYDMCIVIAFGILAGGRLVEVIFYEWEYYGTNRLHILWIWLGGMSTHGILLGGTVGLWVFCKLSHKSFLDLADQIVIPASMIMGLGRIGNFIDGQIVGSITSVWWAVKFPDVEGFRHAVVLYDGVKNLLLIPVLLLIRTFDPPRGVLLGCFIFGYGFFRFIIDFFREYRTELFGIPPGQEFNIAMTLAGLVLVVWAFNGRNSQIQHSTGNQATDHLKPGDEKPLTVRRVIFVALLAVPMVIPSDWTQDIPARYGKRHDGMTHSALYPEVNEAEKSYED